MSIQIEGNPDTPGRLIHFTGRPRAGHALPDWAPTCAEERLSHILSEGLIRGSSHSYSVRHAVVCLSELSDLALHYQLLKGFTPRGRYAPWAIVLHKAPLVEFGAGPVWYVSQEEWTAMNSLPDGMRDRRVRSVPERKR